MQRSSDQQKYFTWLVKQIGGFEKNGRRYEFMLSALYDRDFYWVLVNDENRAEDGKALRYEYSKKVIDDLEGPCRMLEMLVALAKRIERDIMADRRYGDRSGEWFWNMIDELGLDRFDDRNFDIIEVDVVLDRCLDREYQRDGTGSPFKSVRMSLGKWDNFKALELWNQANLYYGDV